MQDITRVEFSLLMSRFVVGNEGNLSYRTTAGFCIKSSGYSIRDNRFVSCNLDGIPVLEQSDKPSIEVDFHSLIYKNSDYRFIAHTHPVNVLKVLCSNSVNEFAHNYLFPDQVVFNGERACIVPYATPGEDLAYQILNAVAERGSWPSIFLLKNHGIICCSNSMRQAVIMTEICEKSADIFLGAKSLGSITYLTDDQVNAIKNHNGEKYRNENIR